MHCDGGILNLKVSRSLTSVVAASEDGTLRAWALPSGKERWRVTRRGQKWITALAISPDDTLVATNFDKGVIRLWNASTGELVASLKGHAADDEVGSVVFSPDGQMLVSGGRDATIRVWSMKTKKAVQVLELAPTTRVFEVAFSPDGAFFAAVMFSVETGKCWSAIWNAATFELSRELKGHSNIIWSVAFSPDSRLLATSSADNSIRIWSLATKAKALVLRGHRGIVRRVRFSPDGTSVVSGSSDKTVRRWNVTTGELQATHTFAHAVHAFDFLDERRVIVGLSPPGSKDGARSDIEIVTI